MRKPFRTRAEAEWPAARARFRARTSTSSRRIVVEISRAIHSPYSGRHERAMVRIDDPRGPEAPAVVTRLRGDARYNPRRVTLPPGVRLRPYEVTAQIG